MDQVHSKERKVSRDWNSFHPSRYERARIEGEEFAGFPLAFDGLRFDFVKGYEAWMIGLLAKYRYQKKDGREFTPFVVGEYWSGSKDIDH